jgi:baseplate J-like protein
MAATDFTNPVFFCSNENRRERVRTTLGSDGTLLLNGIDYLEVATGAQTGLEVHFIHPLPGEPSGVPSGAPVLAADNIRILGGERIKNIDIVSVTAAGAVLSVIVDTPGDFSIYTLALVAGGGSDKPPAGFDPRLSRVQFSFKAACPSEFDCRTTSSCAPEPLPSPRIDYLARDYQSFRRVLLDRLRLLMPNWTETSGADFPIALTELLAYVGDQLSYAQDAAATEAYPGTALHRISLRRHARLRDYRMHEGCNARVWMQMDVEPGGAADGALLEIGTPFFAGASDQLARARAAEFDDLDPERSAIFESMEPLVVRATHNRFEFYTWSDDECTLCQGATSATLRRPEGAVLEPGMVLIIEEIRDPRSTSEGRIDHRWAVRLTDVVEREDPLDGSPLYEVAWSKEDALPFSFIISRRVDDVLVENISIARGNVVLADHGLTVQENPADPSLSPRQAPVDDSAYAPVLSESGLTFREEPSADLTGTPATRSVTQLAAAAQPQTWLESAGERWTARSDLLGSDGDATEFVVEIDNRRRAHLRFGDNEHGRRPSLGQSFTALFRIGNGLRGNIGAEAISAILKPGAGFRRVRNPLPATGGTDPEPMEEARQFAPVAFRTQSRAVTLADYAEIARSFPGVQQARAEFRWLASWYTVVLAVDRLGGEPLDETFRAGLLAHMEQFRMAGYDLDIREPVSVPLDILVHVCLRPGANRTAVYRELQERLGSGPGGLFHPDRLTFGQRIYMSQILVQAAAVAGVDHARIVRFKRLLEPAASELEDGFLEVSGLELPQLANDPSFPERGTIEFELEGGI